MFSSGRGRLLCLTLLLLTGCQSAQKMPAFTASGYLADRGVVRIWRKNTPPDITIRTLYSPFDRTVTEQSDYHWQNGQLLMIKRHLSGTSPDDVTLRFDNQGNVSFMQRQLARQRESVSQDDIELYRFDARRLLQISDGLQAGRVTLIQGTWEGNNRVTTCHHQTISAGLDAYSVQMISREQRQSAGAPIYIAWLRAPEGVQLLKATTENLCLQAPASSDL
ncbi:DUF1481 domain-containing protein [Tatumella terrea]|uniref:DUF1481 domain-containing protein n=1 Tax=Tatumella terrea TaxID=419007 RepID=A0ABW1W0M7_9GAMM